MRLQRIFLAVTVVILSAIVLSTVALNRMPPNYISTSSEVNRQVGYQIIEFAKNKANKYMCLERPMTFLVIDVGRTASTEKTSQLSLLKYDIVNSWLFESNKARDTDSSISQSELITYYTRLDSANYTLSHEMGHRIFSKYIMNNKLERNGYSSIAPDWLDEAAAIAFENEIQTKAREKAFFRALTENTLIPMNNFLQYRRSAPVHSGNTTTLTWKNGELVKTRSKSSDSPKVASLDKEDNTDQYITQNINLYYAQANIFKDYLISQSQNSCILADIGRYVADGHSFEQWLKVQNQIHGIHNISEIESTFIDWARKEAVSNDESD